MSISPRARCSKPRALALIETARGLGANQWRLARDIALPLARPAIAAGVALALLETLNDIGASEYLGVQTLTLSIFTTWLNRSSLPGAAQIACLMLLAVAALIALERYGRRRQGFTGLDTRPGRARRVELAGGKRWLALAGCLLPVCLGFLIPLLHLFSEVMARGLLIGFDPSLVRHTLSTVLLAGSATILILILGFGAAFALRLVRRPLASVCFFIAGLGYAVPGTVLALGLLSPLVAIDEAINQRHVPLRSAARRIERRGDLCLCRALPRHLDRFCSGGSRPHLDRTGRRRAHRRHAPLRTDLGDPSAAARGRRCGAPRFLCLSIA